MGREGQLSGLVGLVPRCQTWKRAVALGFGWNPESSLGRHGHPAPVRPPRSVDGGLEGRFWWCIAQPLLPAPPTHTHAHTHTPSVFWACLQVCPSPRSSSMPRAPCAWNRGGFPEWVQPAARCWPFSSGILQQGARTPVAAPRRGEAPRTRGSTLAARALFPRWVGRPFHFGSRFVGFAGPPFRLCPDVAHSFQQARLPSRAPVPRGGRGHCGLCRELWVWATPEYLCHGGLEQGSCLRAERSRVSCSLGTSTLLSATLAHRLLTSALCVAGAVTNNPHLHAETKAQRWAARPPSRGPSPGAARLELGSVCLQSHVP